MIFKFNVDDFNGLSIVDVKNALDQSYKKPLSEILLFDLLVDEEKNEGLRHGVYMYFNDKNECVYIGKCSSSHFAHRIGGHFGMSPKYGMNTFLKRAVEKLGLKYKDKDKAYQGYVEALPIIANYELLIINSNRKGNKFISSLEKVLHITYRPELNFPKGYPKTYKAIADNAVFIEEVKKL